MKERVWYGTKEAKCFWQLDSNDLIHGTDDRGSTFVIRATDQTDLYVLFHVQCNDDCRHIHDCSLFHDGCLSQYERIRFFGGRADSCAGCLRYDPCGKAGRFLRHSVGYCIGLLRYREASVCFGFEADEG